MSANGQALPGNQQPLPNAPESLPQSVRCSALSTISFTIFTSGRGLAAGCRLLRLIAPKVPARANAVASDRVRLWPRSRPGGRRCVPRVREPAQAVCVAARYADDLVPPVRSQPRDAGQALSTPSSGVLCGQGQVYSSFWSPHSEPSDPERQACSDLRRRARQACRAGSRCSGRRAHASEAA